MTKPKSIMRGLQNIKTYTGRVGALNEPYRAFMRMSCLEMEKARKGKERDSALQRVDLIEQRFREIEAEEAELLASLGPVIPKTATHGQEANPSRGGAGPKGEEKAPAFKVKY